MSQPAISHDAPVGVFDSGVGGISVLKHIHLHLPAEDLIYCADSLHAPYGTRSCEEICARSMTVATFLIEKGAKAIVVACNTATAAAIDLLRKEFPISIIGMEPAVKPAAQATQTGVVGVLATVGTLKSAQFAALLENFGHDVQVVTAGCTGLVEQIEQGNLKGDETAAIVERYLRPLLDAGADTIVLGCTHYPFVRSIIQQLAGPDITLIDTGAAVARQLESRLKSNNLLAPASRQGAITFYSNSTNPRARQIMENLWGDKVNLNQFP